MRRNGHFIVIIICLMSMLAMAACGSEGESGEDEAGVDSESSETENTDKDAYDEYIRSALETVNQDKKPADPSPTATPTDIVNYTPVNPTVTPLDDLAVSSMENPNDFSDDYATLTPVPTDTGDVTPTPTGTISPTPTGTTSPTPTGTASPSPTEDPNASPTPTPTPYITPDEFDVGKCCIYINGESDSAYGTEVISAINKARSDLGYKPLITNKGLGTCADRRTRETAANFDHTRPNGLPFYSLAPEHFKAEMLILGQQKAEDAVDTMIKKDPVSRRLIFTEKYQSIGASSFKCNGSRFTVVSFGL